MVKSKVKPSPKKIKVVVTEEQIKAAIKKLGRGSGSIARKLQALHITGVMEHPSRCPVANYLRKEFKQATPINVTGSSITVNGATITAVPEAIDDFIEGFDQGDYPALIAKRRKKSK